MTGEHLPKQVILRKKEDRRILAGHPWVFSNEVRETLGEPGPGDVVELRSAGGASLGIGFYNPHSLIAFRRLSPVLEPVDTDLFRRRISRAASLRGGLHPDGSVYRLVHGESDYLPGLVVDRYNDLLSVQTLSFGMNLHLPEICDVLEELYHPAGIVERNESPMRLLEQLPQQKGILRGKAEPTVISEYGLKFRVDVLNGQKTGFFLDQRENRIAARRYCRDATVLDCFCNDGGFALHAVAAGARSALGVDISREAVGRARENAGLNGLQADFEEADVFEKLEQLGSSGTQFDVVILDPPSFAKSRKSVPSARKGYRDLNAAAMKVLRRGGILLTSSCSHHIDPETFLDTVSESARRAVRELQLLDWRGAAPDHPVLPGVPETRYLKFAVCCIW